MRIASEDSSGRPTVKQEKSVSNHVDPITPPPPPIAPWNQMQITR